MTKKCFILHSYLESKFLHLEILEYFPCQYNLKKTLMHFINVHKSFFIDLIPSDHNFPVEVPWEDAGG